MKDMKKLLENIQLFTKKHRELTTAVLGLLVVVLFCSTVFGTLQTQASEKMDNPIDGISDERSMVELEGTKETVAESFAGADDRAEEEKDQENKAEEDSDQSGDDSQSDKDSGNTSKDGEGDREGDEGNNEDNRGSNQGDNPKKDKNLEDEKKDEQQEYFRTSIVDGDTLTVQEYEYTVTQLTDLEVESVQNKIGDGKFSSYNGKLNLDTGENQVVVKVTYIGEDGKSFDVQKTYTLYVNIHDVIIRCNLARLDGTTVTSQTLSFEAAAECAGEQVELTGVLENANGSQEIPYQPEGSYTVELAEGVNTIQLHAEKNGREATESCQVIYEIPSDKKFSVQTNLEDRNNQTVNVKLFDFDAYGFRGDHEVGVIVTLNGSEVQPVSDNYYEVLLENGANTIGIIPFEGEETGNTWEYTIHFQKKSEGEGGDAPDNPERPIVSCPELETAASQGVNSSILSFTVYAQNYRGDNLPASQIYTECNGVPCGVTWANDGQVAYEAELNEGYNTIYVEVDDGEGNIYKENYMVEYTLPEHEVTGTVTLSVEATTVGLGYLIAPVQVEITQNETAADLVVQMLEANGYIAEYTGSLDSNFYLAHITADWNYAENIQVPEDLEAHLEEINEASAEPVYPKDWYSNSLGEFSVCSGSGWMYSVNGLYPNYSMCDYVLQDGDSVRVRFTLYYGSDIGGAGALGNASNEDGSVGNWEREW